MPDTPEPESRIATAIARFQTLPRGASKYHRERNDIREFIGFSEMLNDEAIADKAHAAMDDLIYRVEQEEG